MLNQTVINPLNITSLPAPTQEDLEFRTKIQKLNQENTKLMQERNRLENDPHYLEKKAKENLENINNNLNIERQ